LEDTSLSCVSQLRQRQFFIQEGLLVIQDSLSATRETEKFVASPSILALQEILSLLADCHCAAET
jgi:hypothetical protein